MRLFLGIIYQFTPVMSSEVEISGYCHSGEVEISAFCHSERSEESVNSVTMAVCYLLFHFPYSDRAVLCYFLPGHNTKVYLLNDSM